MYDTSLNLVNAMWHRVSCSIRIILYFSHQTKQSSSFVEGIDRFVASSWMETWIFEFCCFFWINLNSAKIAEAWIAFRDAESLLILSSNVSSFESAELLSRIVILICAGLKYPILILPIRSSQYWPILKSVKSWSNCPLAHSVFGTTTGYSLVLSIGCIFVIYELIAALISSRFFQLRVLWRSCSLAFLISSFEHRHNVGIGFDSLNPASIYIFLFRPALPTSWR